MEVEWEPIPGMFRKPNAAVVQKNKPRLLEPDELDLLVSRVPSPRSKISAIADYIQRQVKLNIREQLSREKMVPDRDHLTNCSIRIGRYCLEALEAAGTSGITSSSSIVAFVTQSALSSFHHSGSSVTSSIGTGKLGSVFNANTPPDDRSMFVHLKDKTLSRREVFQVARQWITVMLHDVIKKHIVYSKQSISESEIGKYWWSFENREYWKTFYPNYANDDRLDTDIGVLRLYLNLELIDKFGITMEMIVKPLRSNTTYTIYNSLEDGFIEIITRPEIREMSDRDFDGDHIVEMNYLEAFVYPAIIDILISGYHTKSGNDDYVEYIKDIEIVTEDLNNIVVLTEKPKYILGTVKNSSPIDGADVIERLKRFQLISKEHPTKQLKNKGFAISKEGLNPNFLDNFKEVGKIMGYNYVMTYGSAYQSIMIRQDINTLYTTTNDVRSMFAVLGIEATRKFLIETLKQIIGPSNCSVAHIELIVDAIIIYGEPKPIRSTTMATEGVAGIISLATARAAFDTFIRGSLSNSCETVRNPVPAILCGTEPELGTNLNKIVEESPIGRHELKIGTEIFRIKVGKEINQQTVQQPTFELNPLSSDFGVKNIEEESYSMGVVKTVKVNNSFKNKVKKGLKSQAFVNPPQLRINVLGPNLELIQ